MEVPQVIGILRQRHPPGLWHSPRAGGRPGSRYANDLRATDSIIMRLCPSYHTMAWHAEPAPHASISECPPAPHAIISGYPPRPRGPQAHMRAISCAPLARWGAWCSTALGRKTAQHSPRRLRHMRGVQGSHLMPQLTFPSRKESEEESRFILGLLELLTSQGTSGQCMNEAQWEVCYCVGGPVFSCMSGPVLYEYRPLPWQAPNRGDRTCMHANKNVIWHRHNLSNLAVPDNTSRCELGRRPGRVPVSVGMWC